jgi:hypothetical protein
MRPFSSLRSELWFRQCVKLWSRNPIVPFATPVTSNLGTAIEYDQSNTGQTTSLSTRRYPFHCRG